ncbi:unnamed protein product [Clonostachys chloroleuca]|uniref:NADPH-dependent diflavin oxidoreductase 1 n=1 Tax=Clonostachys chloroleuca TaxID=1926264 RepID=A0AA35V9A9_9HYPO|nr:unnamed protein product [Clonostachys chloroleuca]
MASPGRSILILYGSETGNSQDIAEELGSLCQRLHFKSHVEELDGADLNSLLQHQFVIFVISTTGQGDMPHNSLLFWRKLLRKKLPPGCLSQVRYTCFGLGDSTYLKFNWAARKLIRRLEQLGANTFFDCFEADERFDDGIEGAFSSWAGKFYDHLLEEYPPPDGRAPISDDSILPPRWSLSPALSHSSTDSAKIISHSDIDVPPPGPLPIPDGWEATLAESKRMTPLSHWQDVRLLGFDVPSRADGQKLACNPGDCLTIYPKNFPEDVQKLITLMSWETVANQKLDLSACPSLPRNLHASQPCTIRQLLLENIDFTSIPRRSFFKSMSYFATDPNHKERLLEFTKTEFLDEYFDYATRSRRTILEVLDEFTSVKIPPERLLDVFPLIRGRDFSIANGGALLAHPTGDESITRVELLVALVRYRTILRKPRQGLCSRYLASLPPNASLRVGYKPVLTPIHGAQNAQRPLIAMATGTGLAPVRCLIHERLTHPNPGPMLLFFGNRNRSKDFFFEKEWDDLSKDGNGGAGGDENATLTVFTAFSRDQPDKVYIQDILRREANTVNDLIPRNAIFSVCGGSTKMADACKETVFGSFRRSGEEPDREKHLESLTWWQEIW